MIARCPRCGSMWVCFNWISGKSDNIWIHECWNCDNIFDTPNKVRRGVPYWILRRFHKFKGSYPNE
jgi:hypothetical protein